MSEEALGEIAQKNDPMEKTIKPRLNTQRLPLISLNLPNSNKREEIVSKYITTTHSIIDNGSCNSLIITGKAIFTMLLSSVDINIPDATKEKINHLLGDGLGLINEFCFSTID